MNADVFTYHTSFNIPARQTNPMQPHDLSFHPYLQAEPRHHGRRYGVDGGAGGDGGGWGASMERGMEIAFELYSKCWIVTTRTMPSKHIGLEIAAG